MIKKIFKKILKLFVNEKEQTYIPNHYDPIIDHIDKETGEITKSAIIYNKANERFLKLNDKSCAMVIHPHGKVEVIFTKLYDEQDQKITIEEETLMAIAVFLKQPGFAEMLRTEFHNIAMDNLSILTKEQNEL